MVCEPHEPDLDIGIPAIMLPQHAGTSLIKFLGNSSSVSVQLYSPKRPMVDVAEVFLWLMAVATILCASYWSAWRAREAAIEQDKLLKDGSNECNVIEGSRSGVVLEINIISAVLFVVVASCFLIMLYKLMSSWFIEVLVVLFAIGGVEGLQTCLVALLSCFRWFERFGQSYIKIPFLGPVSYLTLAISPFCIAFAVLWAVYRHISFAWIGQDILVSIAAFHTILLSNIISGACISSISFFLFTVLTLTYWLGSCTYLTMVFLFPFLLWAWLVGCQTTSYHLLWI
ncbi:hypothetical protein AABB24_022286 [Solanum stoloniferum]